VLLEVALRAGGCGLLLPGCCGCRLVLQLGLEVLKQQQMKQGGRHEGKVGELMFFACCGIVQAQEAAEEVIGVV
jgi:hypothetical protein